MASPEAQIKKLKSKVATLEKRLAKERARVKQNKQCCADTIKWIKREVKWSEEVTRMLRQIDWVALEQAFPGGGGTNPPQKPPIWPPN
jgi:hypothetical protein